MKHKKESGNPNKDNHSIQKKSWQDSNNKSKSSENFVDNSPEALEAKQLQQMADMSSESIQFKEWESNLDHSSKEETVQKKENNTGLPDNLKAGMENLSGQSLDDVKVHYNSDKPEQLNAHAYAQGTDIHLAPKQEKHLPHELGHVVQQKDGIVKPTTQVNGANVNDDKSLEKGADTLGAQALKQPKQLKTNNSETSGQNEYSNTFQFAPIVQRDELLQIDSATAISTLKEYSKIEGNQPKDGESKSAFIGRFKTWLAERDETIAPEVESELEARISIVDSTTAIDDFLQVTNYRSPKESETIDQYISSSYLWKFDFYDTRYITEEGLASLHAFSIVASDEASTAFEEFHTEGSLPQDSLVQFKQQLKDKKELLSQEGLDAIMGGLQSELGENISDAMGEANIRDPHDATQDQFQYPRVEYQDQGELNNGMGHLDPKYWEYVQFSSFILKAGVKPSEAMEAAFNGPTRLECLSTARAVVAKGLLDTLGAETFDKHFAHKSVDDPGVVIGTNTGIKDRVEELMYRPNITSTDDLLVGDWIYYKNDARYPQKHPGGLWQGENCIYDGPDSFSGFGLNAMTEEHLHTSMIRSFNEDPDERDIERDPRLDPSHDQYKKELAEAKDAEPVGFLFDNVIRLHLKKFLAK
ncbi:MAG: DUF4157 domain-containing protein [Saprospiraceae bacterium]|nr:DUF4157 domain-containing protein [Saprospiraceae bacterium]